MLPLPPLPSPLVFWVFRYAAGAGAEALFSCFASRVARPRYICRVPAATARPQGHAKWIVREDLNKSRMSIPTFIFGLRGIDIHQPAPRDFAPPCVCICSPSFPLSSSLTPPSTRVSAKAKLCNKVHNLRCGNALTHYTSYSLRLRRRGRGRGGRRLAQVFGASILVRLLRYLLIF